MESRRKEKGHGAGGADAGQNTDQGSDEHSDATEKKVDGLESDLKAVDDAVDVSHSSFLKSKQPVRELAVEPLREDEIGEEGGQK